MLASFQNKYTENACLFRRKTRYTDDNGSTPCDEGRRVIYKEIVRHTGSKQRLLEQFKNLGNNSAQQTTGKCCHCRLRSRTCPHELSRQHLHSAHYVQFVNESDKKLHCIMKYLTKLPKYIAQEINIGVISHIWFLSSEIIR